MTCEYEFGAFEKELLATIRRIAETERFSHECYIHKDEESCKELKGLREELRIQENALKEAITDLSRCIERAVKK
jgi:cell pole-organizing protein PopZ